MAGEQGVLQLRQDGLLVAEDVGEQRLTVGDAGDGVGPDLFLDRARLPSGRPELADRCGARLDPFRCGRRSARRRRRAGPVVRLERRDSTLFDAAAEAPGGAGVPDPLSASERRDSTMGPNLPWTPPRAGRDPLTRRGRDPSSSTAASWWSSTRAWSSWSWSSSTGRSSAAVRWSSGGWSWWWSAGGSSWSSSTSSWSCLGGRGRGRGRRRGRRRRRWRRRYQRGAEELQPVPLRVREGVARACRGRSATGSRRAIRRRATA